MSLWIQQTLLGELHVARPILVMTVLSWAPVAPVRAKLGDLWRGCWLGMSGWECGYGLQ